MLRRKGSLAMRTGKKGWIINFILAGYNIGSGWWGYPIPSFPRSAGASARAAVLPKLQTPPCPVGAGAQHVLNHTSRADERPRPPRQRENGNKPGRSCETLLGGLGRAALPQCGASGGEVVTVPSQGHTALQLKQ